MDGVWLFLYEAAYRYNGQNRMAYSEMLSHVEQSRIRTGYAYDAFGRRTEIQDEGGQAVRTLYDGTGFETIREGVTFTDGRFTTRYSEGMQGQANTGTEGSRYRWVGDEDSTEARTRSAGEAGYRTVSARYTGTGVTLYGKGEAVAVSRSAGAGTRGGSAYLGKDLLGSVRSTTDDNGNLEDRYEYDAFGKPYKGDLTTGMNLGYTGKPYDSATGLYNYGYRDYKPEAARFTTVDPIRDGNNWFAFVNNDPVNYTDPLGLSASENWQRTWQDLKDLFSGRMIKEHLAAAKTRREEAKARRAEINEAMIKIVDQLNKPDWLGVSNDTLSMKDTLAYINENSILQFKTKKDGTLVLTSKINELGSREFTRGFIAQTIAASAGADVYISKGSSISLGNNDMSLNFGSISHNKIDVDNNRMAMRNESAGSYWVVVDFNR